MTADEEALLVLLGFDFHIEIRQMCPERWKEWNLRYNELKEYKKIHGHCRVPTSGHELCKMDCYVPSEMPFPCLSHR